MTATRTEDFLAMWTRLTGLYLEGRLDEALALAGELEERFPDRRASMSHARACLHGALGETKRALSVARHAVRRGWWWSERNIADPDLDAVRPDPEFQAITAEMAGSGRRPATGRRRVL